ncbi:unnamed protein product [Schistocephalus solidus]|uniref:DDE Tnp4 domain-containing protein n=1 Tax=Schistocephalus solidus TaxID=70667 RepID=A0A183SZ67_SCHSO|nr:unnamed protein product [Schistocephalus solidus]
MDCGRINALGLAYVGEVASADNRYYLRRLVVQITGKGFDCVAADRGYNPLIRQLEEVRLEEARSEGNYHFDRPVVYAILLNENVSIKVTYTAMALRENTQDQDDKDFLTNFRGMLTKIRVRLESDLSRRAGLHLQLAGLISTGHVGSVPRSVNLPPLPASSFRGRSSSTSPLLGTLATGQSRATINTPSADCSASALPLSGSCPWDINHIFRAADVMLVGESSLLNMSPMTSTTSTMTCDNRETQARTASSLLGGTVLAMGLAKVEEIERLTEGKERLAGIPALGNFVMGMCVLDV